MAKVTKWYDFEAAHQLPGHKGKCAELHGHSYRVGITISGPIQPIRGLSDDGFVIDFGDLSDFVKPLIKKYCDHKFLNDTLNIPRTTAELIACWFFGAVTKFLEQKGFSMLRVEKVAVQETATGVAEVDATDWAANGCPGLDVTLDDEPGSKQVSGPVQRSLFDDERG